MDRRISLISVFDDTLECISNDVALHMAQQQSIASQKLILETDAISTPVPKFKEEAKVLVTHNRSFEAAAHYKGQRVCVTSLRLLIPAEEWFMVHRRRKNVCAGVPPCITA